MTRTPSGKPLARCFATLALLGAVACGGLDAEPRDPTNGVTAVQFRDVVVPDGLALIDDEHQSYSRQKGSWRTGHFVYRGATNVAESAAYVLQRMQQHGWQETANEATDANRCRLEFVRGVYRVEYQIVREYGRTQMTVDYVTTVGEEPIDGTGSETQDAGNGADQR